MKYHGVKVATAGRSWSATACVAGRAVYLGVFSTPEEAARAFDSKTFEATGDLRRLNFPREYHDATTDLACRECNQVKPVAAFRVPGRPHPKTVWHCDDCRQQSATRRIDRHQTQHGHSRATGHRKQSIENALRWLLYRAKSRAVERDLDFDLDLTFIAGLWASQSGRCKLTGRTMLLGRGHETRPSAASIDRIRSDGGYTQDNVQLACWAANVAKQSFTIAEFVALCRDVVSIAGDVVAQENK